MSRFEKSTAETVLSDNSSRKLLYSSDSSKELRFKSETIKPVLHFECSSESGTGLLAGAFVGLNFDVGFLVGDASDGVSVGIVA